MKLSLSFIKLCVFIMGATIFHSSSIAKDFSERFFYLGVLNGNVQGDKFVIVQRTIPDPLIYKFNVDKEIPRNIIIRNAVAKETTQGEILLTVKENLINNQEAFIKLALKSNVDGEYKPIRFSQVGDDVFIKVGAVKKTFELKSHEIIELKVPVGYKGNIKVKMQLDTD